MRKNISFVTGVCILLTISFFSGCINVPEEFTQMSIVSFDVKPGVIKKGEFANLSWVVISASSVNIDNGIGSVALTGHQIIQPTHTMTYTLIASNATTTKSATITIIVNDELILLTIMVGSQSYNYSLRNLTAFGSISGQGQYINKAGKITGPNNYTGIPINQLLNSFPNLPTNYTFHAVASDDYSRNFSKNEVNGHIVVYNDTGAEIGTENMTMIIAYKVDGLLLNETTKGPLRIAFISQHPVITNSGLWVSSLVKIELI